MPERPLLILPAPGAPVGPRKKQSRGTSGHLPGADRQSQRLGPRLEELRQAFEDKRLRLQAEASGIVPEEVLVLETVGPVDDFIAAVHRIPGMEWLAEVDEEDIPPDDDFFAEDKEGHPKPGKSLSGRMFLVFTSQRALSEMLSLWRRWLNGSPFPHGQAKWKHVFAQLYSVRVWGVTDRLQETGVLDDWRERLAQGQQVVPCEIELWFRQSQHARTAAHQRISSLVAAQDGRIVSSAVVEEIGYHGFLAELPDRTVQAIIQQADDVALVQCEGIQFVRAAGQMSVTVGGLDRGSLAPTLDLGPLPHGMPVVALLDGLPLENHQCLQGRIVVDDPDNLAAEYEARNRQHGTAMASLIIHGELDAHAPPIERPLYVRPILCPDRRDWGDIQVETAPEHTLIVDLIHRAIRRLFERDGDQEPVAPDVCVVNLSIGIKDRPFARELSPLARLLDWLAWRYGLLFIVSAGNHDDPIQLDISADEFRALGNQDRQTAVLKALATDTRNRRLLSPAEAINALTIGASHSDSSPEMARPNTFDPYMRQGMPSPINAQGMGYRRAIKPDLLAPGGRVLLEHSMRQSDPALLEVWSRTVAPGHKVASPGTEAGDTSATSYCRGTSNATALTSRSAGILHQMLQSLRGEPGGELIDDVPASVWLKALIVHAADWGVAWGAIEEALRTPENSQKFREYVTRLLGYGIIDTQRVSECTITRATALGGGTLDVDTSHIHTLPLPPSLSGQRCWRRLTVTLAWLTPVNPLHRAWRRAELWFGNPGESLLVGRTQADGHSVQRGTVQHEVLEGERAATFVQSDNLVVQVNCRAHAGTLEDSVPYALAITLEVKEETAIPIYDEIRLRVMATRVGVRSGG